MSETCPNCARPVLPTDTVCWHCNYPLPKRPKTRAATPAAAAADEPVEYDLRALAIYGLLTLALILSLWMVMRALGQRPTLVRSAGLAKAGWLSVTDDELRYTLDLPDDWLWFDLAFRDQATLLPDLTARQPYIDRALRPLAAAVGDAAVVAVAIGAPSMDVATPAPLAVIGRSPRLAGQTPEELLSLLPDRESISFTDIVNAAGRDQARFSVLDAANDYRCRHLAMADAAAGYLVAACAPVEIFGTIEADLDALLDSFQVLEN